MPEYVFRGRLCGYICPDCPEALSEVTIRLYRHREEQPVSALAAADPKETFAILDDDAVEDKSSRLIAEATTDELGRFTFELGEKQGYGGEAFEIDVFCGTVPHRPTPPKPLDPLQFSLTTLHPQWRETEGGYVAAWEYCIPSRFWCAIRRRFGAWTICGHVTVCETKEPVTGVRVLAFDRDWLQDDPLGVALTGAGGHYRIDYASEDFKRTPFFGISLEWVGGPDLYFRVELPDGTVLMQEDPSAGRAPGRENVGPCACVDLCLPKEPPVKPTVIPMFTAVGEYEIDPAAADFAGDGTTTAGSLAFTSTIPLNGALPNGDEGAVDLQYRFQVTKVSPTAGAPVDVTAPHARSTQIGILQYFRWNGSAWVPTSTPYYVNNPGATVSIPQASGPDLVVPVNKDVGPGGWINAPRENELFATGRGLFKHQEQLLILDTTTFTNEAFDLTTPAPGVAAGGSVPAAKRSEKPVFQVVFEARPVGSSTLTATNTLTRIAFSNTAYTYVRHPEWAGGTASGTAVVSLDIGELISPGASGCDRLTDHVHALYTCYHPYLSGVEVYFEGNPPLPASILPAVVAGEAASGSPGHDFDISALQPCAYILWLKATPRLTQGHGALGTTIWDHIAFCKADQQS
jgi:hypothetical protein